MIAGDEIGLVGAICAAMDDEAPKLIYADWLDEHNREWEGELLRIQIKLAKIGFPPRVFRSYHKLTIVRNGVIRAAVYKRVDNNPIKLGERIDLIITGLGRKKPKRRTNYYNLPVIAIQSCMVRNSREEWWIHCKIDEQSGTPWEGTTLNQRRWELLKLIRDEEKKCKSAQVLTK